MFGYIWIKRAIRELTVLHLDIFGIREQLEEIVVVILVTFGIREHSD